MQRNLTKTLHRSRRKARSNLNATRTLCSNSDDHRRHLCALFAVTCSGRHDSPSAQLVMRIFASSNASLHHALASLCLQPARRSFACSACRSKGRVLVEQNGKLVYRSRSSLNENKYAAPIKPKRQESLPSERDSKTSVLPMQPARRTVTATTASERVKTVKKEAPEQKSFEGVDIPAKPLAPASDECCMSGALSLLAFVLPPLADRAQVAHAAFTTYTPKICRTTRTTYSKLVQRSARRAFRVHDGLRYWREERQTAKRKRMPRDEQKSRRQPISPSWTSACGNSCASRCALSATVESAH